MAEPSEDEPVDKLAGFSADMFRNYVGEPFQAETPAGETLDLLLAEVTDAGGARTPDARAPFSLVFSGPAGSPLSQATYEVRHAELGTFPLFLVPIQPDSDGARYEAVFG